MIRSNKLISKIALTTLLAMTTVVPTFAKAYDYQFETTTDKTFGNHTFTSDTSYYNNNENVRKDKNYSMLPPGYGLFSGEFETPNSNPYMTALDITKATNDTFSVPDDANNTGQLLESTSLMNNTGGYFTEPMYYDDGSMGRLKIDKIGVDIKVYEGETLANMRVGVGHFDKTSAWDGNVALAGHNRGSSGYFEDVKNLTIGDTLTYSTPYGTRTYKVIVKQKISDKDLSGLGWSDKNILTLITCVENSPSQRWLVQAEEVVK